MMKRSDIRNAYDQMTPSREQKDRMLSAILEGENGKKKGKYQAQSVKTHKWSWIPAVAALIAVIAAGAFVLGRPASDDLLLSEDETEYAREEIADVYAEIPQLKAAKEWREYQFSYTGTVEEEVTYPYSSWGCRNLEMAAKFDEIWTKYQLTFPDLDERMTDSVEFLAEEVGIGQILKEGAGHQTGNCAYWSNGQFYIAGSVTLKDSSWTYPIKFMFHRTYPNVLLYDYWEFASNETIDCWRYVHSSGSHMIMGIGDVYGFLYAPVGDDIFFVLVTNPTVGDIQSGEHTITRDAMEAFAETFCFTTGNTQNWDEDEIPVIYDEIIRTCRTALEEGWDAEKCQAFNISAQFANSEYASANAGYQITDIDGNGTPELIIGHGDYIWNLYTLQGDDTAVQLITDTNDGTVYHLAEGAHIIKELTTKEEGYHHCFLLNGISLKMEISIYAVDTDYRDMLTGQDISSEEALDMIHRYDRLEPVWTYFHDVPDSLQENSEILELYLLALEKYKTAVAEKWNSGKCVEEGISILISNYTEQPEQFGFTMLDLDRNGAEELLITDGDVILDMYAIVNNEPRLVFSGWERNSYYLADGNNIFNRGSNSAASTLYNFYYVDNGSLVLTESVIFDATDDPGNPWFYQTGNDDPTPIREEEARELIDSFAILSIPFTPFADGETDSTSESEEWEKAKQTAFDIIKNGEEFGYAEYIAWLIPWREQEFENPRPLYYCLHDCNEDGVADLILGYEDEVTAIWSYIYDDKSKTEHLTLLPFSDVDLTKLDQSWINWDIRLIEDFLRNE